MATTTALAVCQQVAKEIGSHIALVATSSAPAHDPARIFISFNLTGDPARATHEGHFACVTGTSGIQQNLRVLREVVPVGGLALDGVSGSGAWLPTSTCDLAWPLPIGNTQGIPGILNLLAQGARDVEYEDRIDLSVVAGAYTIDLSAQADWLDSEDRIVRDAQGRVCLYDPPVLSGAPRRQKPERYGRLVLDGGSPSLELQFPYRSTRSSTDAYPPQLAVRRPAYSLVSGSESTTGPTLTSHTLGGDFRELVDATKARCYRYLATATHITDAERQRYAAMGMTAGKAAA